MKFTYFPVVTDLTEKERSRLKRSFGDLSLFIEIWGKYIKDDSVVVDIGANIGIYTICYASLAFRVHAFEGSLYNVEKLVRICRPFNNITIHLVGLADFNEVRELEFYDCREKGARMQKVTFVTYDDYARNHNIKPNFIKMDIEGMEEAALSCMSFTMADVRPVWQIEWHPETCYKPSPVIFQKFVDLNYQIYNEKLEPMPFINKYGNYFMVPKDL